MTVSTKQGDLHCLNPEDRGSKLPWNASNYLPIDIVSHPKRLDLMKRKLDLALQPTDQTYNALLPSTGKYVHWANGLCKQISVTVRYVRTCITKFLKILYGFQWADESIPLTKPLNQFNIPHHTLQWHWLQTYNCSYTHAK